MAAATSLYSSTSSSIPEKLTYIARLEKLKHAYPALRSFLAKITNSKDEGRRLVAKRYGDSNLYGGSPGRCAVLTFHDDSVSCERYDSSDALEQYFANVPSNPSPEVVANQRRLFILEDLEPSFVDVIGNRLGVDPLVFSEQMNTWNFTDSQSIPHRALPSMHQPEQSFTLRYYEIRTLDDEDCIRIEKNQMTHAVNRRRIERWRDIDLPSIEPDRRNAVVRRCASFWTSEAARHDPQSGVSPGWDALILVDPPMDSCAVCANHNSRPHARDKSADQVARDGKPSPSCSPTCLMLEDPNLYHTRKAIWAAQSWIKPGSVMEMRHNSTPYHGGCQSLVQIPTFAQTGISKLEALESCRNMNSAFEEMIFYWTQCPTSTALRATQVSSVNSTYYLLKLIAQHWSHQLELIGYHVANSEWFADDHDANMSSQTTLNWRKELQGIAKVTKDINYTLRQMSRFDHAITLDIERLGVQLGSESPNPDLPLALADAQRDFLAMLSRLRPLRQRVDDLSTIANDVTNLRASLKGIQDGEQSLRLSLFASIIFPLTLVASMLSMGDGYRPGQPRFWVFWAASVPFAFVIAVLLLYGYGEKLTLRAKHKFNNEQREKREKRLHANAHALLAYETA